ncbi:MAG: hypothetical protein CYG60_04655 [Actinobacteria bacterium]|nr:MAG: hypothetical protein CYG60_04655 [Actinomycetota bacterium]
MACVQARYPRRHLHDRPGLRPCPTRSPARLCPGTDVHEAPPSRATDHLPGWAVPQGAGGHGPQAAAPGGRVARGAPRARPRDDPLRELLSERGRFPSRRTFERRLRALTERIGCLGRHLVRLLAPWARSGRAVAIDSTVLRAKGGVWHKKDREAAVVPHSSIDTEAGWTKSGWHGWVYGWKLHLSCTVAGVWIPLAARLTPANAADNRGAPLLIEELPEEARFVLGDSHYNARNVREACLAHGRFLVASGRGPYPHVDRAWRCGACFTGCATSRSRTSTGTSRPSSMPTVRCPPGGDSTPRASPWGRSSLTNSRCSTATSKGWIPTEGSRPSSEPPKEL